MNFSTKRAVWAAAFAAALGLASRSEAGFSDYIKKMKENLRSKTSKKSERTQENQAVLAVRGLGEDRKKAAEDTERRNFRAIDKLDGIAVSAEELEKFVKEGKLDAR